jgi:hypothetical protein
MMQRNCLGRQFDLDVSITRWCQDPGNHAFATRLFQITLGFDKHLDMRGMNG